MSASGCAHRGACVGALLWAAGRALGDVPPAVVIETGEAVRTGVWSRLVAWGLWVLVILAGGVLLAAAWGWVRGRVRERRAGDHAFAQLSRRMGLRRDEQARALELGESRGVAAAGELLCPSLWPEGGERKSGGRAQAGGFSGRS